MRKHLQFQRNTRLRASQRHLEGLAHRPVLCSLCATTPCPPSDCQHTCNSQCAHQSPVKHAPTHRDWKGARGLSVSVWYALMGRCSRRWLTLKGCTLLELRAHLCPDLKRPPGAGWPWDVAEASSWTRNARAMHTSTRLDKGFVSGSKRLRPNLPAMGATAARKSPYRMARSQTPAAPIEMPVA